MITGTYEKLIEIARINQCADHKRPLEVAWYGKEKTYVLRCGADHYPDAVVRDLSLTERYKAGEAIPEPILSNVKKSVAKRQYQKDAGVTLAQFPGVPATDLATGELLSADLMTALIDYAYKYHLDPARGHVCVMYSKPYISIDGYLFAAMRSGIHSSLHSRPMTTGELKDYKVGETDHAWIATVNKGPYGAEFTGTGIVTHDEIIGESTYKPGVLRSPVVAAHPQIMAQKRAEWQALRKAFPIGDDEGPDTEVLDNELS